MNDTNIDVIIKAHAAGYQQAMDDLVKRTEDMRSKAEKASKGMSTLDSVVGGLTRSLPILSGGVAGVALGALGLGMNAARTAAEIGRMAGAAGVSAEQMSRYEYAARIAGVESGALTRGLVSLRRAIEDDSAALQVMGVATRDASGEQRDHIDVLADLAERFHEYGDGTAAATLGNEVFGRDFEALQPLLEGGADRLRDLTAEADIFGTVVSDETAVAARQLEEDLRRIGEILPGLAADIGGPLVSALRDAAEEFTAARVSGLGFLRAMGGTFFNGLSNSAKSIEERLADRRDGLRRLKSGKLSDQSFGELLNPMFTVEQMEKEIAYLEALKKKQDEAARATEGRGQAAGEAGRQAAEAAAHELKAREEADKAREKAEREAERAAAAAERARARAAAAAERAARRAAAAGERERARAAAAEQRALQQAARNNAALEEMIEQRNRRELDAAERTVKALEARAAALEDEIALYGLTEAQIAAVQVQRAAERLEIARANGESAEMIRVLERELELRREMSASVGALERRRAADAAEREMEESGRRSSDVIEQSLTDALMRSFEAGGSFAETFARSTENLINTMVLRPTIQAVAQPIASGVSSALGLPGAGATAGQFDILGKLGMGGFRLDATSYGNTFKSFATTDLGSKLGLSTGEIWDRSLTTLGKVGQTAANALPYLQGIYDISKGRYGSGAGTMIGAYFGGPIGAAIGSMIGGMADYTPTYHTGAAVEYGTNNRARDLRHKDTVPDTRVWGGFSETDQKGGAVYADPLKALAKNATDSYERFMSQFGISQQVSAYAAFGADGKDASRGQLRLYDAQGNLLGANSDQLLRGKKYDKNAQKGFQQYAADVGLVLRDSLVAADLPGWVDSVLTSLGDNVSLDQLNAVMADLDVIQGKTLDSNEVWRRATTGLADDFAALGVQMPDSTAAFNELLMASGDLAGELYQLAPAFYELSGVVEAVFAAISTTTAESVRDIEMAMLDKAGQYEYLDREIEGLLQDLAGALNPGEIQRLFEEANAKTMQAWGMLDDSEKQRLGTAYIDRLHELEALAQERLSVAPADYEPAIAAAGSQQDAADKTAAAADNLSAAADRLSEAVARFGAGTDGGADALRGAASELSGAAQRLGGAASSVSSMRYSEVGVS